MCKSLCLELLGQYLQFNKVRIYLLVRLFEIRLKGFVVIEEGGPKIKIIEKTLFETPTYHSELVSTQEVLLSFI